MRFNNRIFCDGQLKASFGHLIVLINKAIDAASGSIFQGGQGDSPCDAEDEQMEKCEQKAFEFAKEIYLGLTGHRVGKIEVVPFNGLKIPNYELDGLISFQEISFQREVYRIHYLAFKAINIIRTKAQDSSNLEQIESKVEMMHIAKEIFLGLTGKYVLESIPV